MKYFFLISMNCTKIHTYIVKYRQAIYGFNANNKRSGVSHFYTNRMSYSFRNDGAFCLQKIFLKGSNI